MKRKVTREPSSHRQPDLLIGPLHDQVSQEIRLLKPSLKQRLMASLLGRRLILSGY